MCHLQSSSCMLPNAALIPPCAATVWDLVGKSFEIQAVLKPASARPKAARRPAPPAPTTIASYSWSYRFLVSSRQSFEVRKHTMTGYWLPRKGEDSLARRGACVMMRAGRQWVSWLAMPSMDSGIHTSRSSRGKCSCLGSQCPRDLNITG